jgi:catechol 2,3-dioxygenase-like lactoylglutathione lyase family enzyme
MMSGPTTRGVHHIGLTVSKLGESAAFFTTVLGWKEVRRKQDPARHMMCFDPSGIWVEFIWPDQ